jgi:hypothetical protein
MSGTSLAETPLRLFDCFLLVSLSPSQLSSAHDGFAGPEPGTNTDEILSTRSLQLSPSVLYQFPTSSFFPSSPASATSKKNAELQKLLRSVPQFCFPDIAKFNSKASSWKKIKMENFSFVLTESTGEKRWGYCRRFLPDESSPTPPTPIQPSSGSTLQNDNTKHQVKALPLCFCIISFIPCFSIFSAILDEMMNLKWKDGRTLIRSVYNQPLPQPGASLRVCIRADLEFQFKRPNDFDSLLDHVNIPFVDLHFEPLLHYLDTTKIVSIFASLLVERRLIFIATRLSTLSACVHAAVAMLYPFIWQHVFIPVLPPSLLSFCCAPMPFVVGVLRSCHESLEKVAAGIENDVILVDIDNNKITTIEGKTPEDDLLLPPEPLDSLMKSIDSVAKRVKEQYSVWGKLLQRKPTGQVHLSRVELKFLANAFIGFMVDLLCSYRSFVVGGKFDTNTFLESLDPSARPLMNLVTQSQVRFLIYVGYQYPELFFWQFGTTDVRDVCTG